MPASGWLQGALGALEVTPLVEAALTGVAMTTLPPASDLEPVTLALNYFRPVPGQSGNLLARARVVNASRFFIFAEAEIEDPQGRQIVHGASHSRIRRMEPPPPPAPAELRAIDEPLYATPDPILRPVPAGVPRETWEANDGLTVMRMFTADANPFPYMTLMGIDYSAVERGRIVITFPASEWFCAYSRFVAPGVVASLGYAAGFTAEYTLLELGESLVALDQVIHFHRQIPCDGRQLRAEASASRQERDRVVADVYVYDGEGNVAARGHGLGAVVDQAQRQKRHAPEAKRILATLLFTDIVDSTGHAERLGDARWHALLDEHRALVRGEIGRCEGSEISTVGDGFFARFDSPARALECARAVRAAVRRLGLEIRVGVHTGECELRGRDLAGVAVHVAARIEAVAAPGDILVSAVVKDLVAGSGMRFEDHGEHTLKGFPGEWRLYSLAE
jgi:class 3 adenylate cyclase